MTLLSINGDFEADLTGWGPSGYASALSIQTTSPHSGTKYLRVTHSAGYVWCLAQTSELVSLLPDRGAYTYRAWVRGTAGKSCILAVYIDGTQSQSSQVSTTGSWQELVFRTQDLLKPASLRVLIYTGTTVAGEYIEVDDVSVDVVTITDPAPFSSGVFDIAPNILGGDTLTNISRWTMPAGAIAPTVVAEGMRFSLNTTGGRWDLTGLPTSSQIPRHLRARFRRNTSASHGGIVLTVYNADSTIVASQTFVSNPVGVWVDVDFLVPATLVASRVVIWDQGTGTAFDYTFSKLEIVDSTLLGVGLDQVLALEIESAPPPNVVVNMIDNPSGAQGGFGWITPVSGSALISANDGWTGQRQGFKYSTNAVSGVEEFYSEPHAATAGRYVGASWVCPYTPYTQYRVRVDFSNTVGYLSSTPWQVFNGLNYDRAFFTPALIPAGVLYVQIHFEISGSPAGTYPHNAAQVQSFGLYEVLLAEGATAAAMTSLPFTEATYWVNVMGPTHEIKINREELNVGMLSATILDATLDPAVGNTIRPGLKCRLRINGLNEVIFTGKIVNAVVTYDLKQPASRQARISLTAADPIRQLANNKRSVGVATIADLPFVLEGCGVPWSVNSNGDQVITAVQVSSNDSASAIDQVAITRDSVRGYAWMSRNGALIANDAAKMPTTNTLLDEHAYSDIEVDFNTDECINSVAVKFLRYDSASGGTAEINYGPYNDDISINQWGAHTKTFTIQALTEVPANIAAFAAAILASNATPVIRVRSMLVPINSDLDLGRATLDLYSLVTASNTGKGLSETNRISSVVHTITPKGWLVEFGFTVAGSVAAPQITPSPAGIASSPDAGLIMMFGAAVPPAGWLSCNGASLLRAGLYANLFAVIGTVYGAADGTHFTLPNFASNFPRGNAVGGSGGEAEHFLSPAELPIHGHNVTMGGLNPQLVQHTAATSTNSNRFMIASGVNGVSVSGGGGNAGHNNLPPYIGVNFIIKT